MNVHRAAPVRHDGSMDLNAPLGDSLRTAGCSACGNVFTSVTGFDKHQRRPAGGDGVICLDPATLGMTQDGHGRWKLPASESKLAHIDEVTSGDSPGDGPQ